MLSIERRAELHSALSDSHRLQIIDALALGDLTVSELAGRTRLAGNLLAHHLDVLEDAGLLVRLVSEGDRRRRYVALQPDRLAELVVESAPSFDHVVFVCTLNSARSQFAAALWNERTGRQAQSAGSHPAAQIHPYALQVAADHGLDLKAAVPQRYDQIEGIPDLVVSVCDRVREEPLPDAGQHVHWSVPDPAAAGDLSAFRSAFRDIEGRVDRLAGHQIEEQA